MPIAETKDNPATSTEKPAQSRTRSRKRIIRRDDLPAAKLSTTKPPPKPKKKPAPAPAPKKPAVSPSDIRLDNLNASLNAFEVWREYRPLVIGVEKEVFRHIARHSLSASKRVVQRLLRQHVQDERYQRNLLSGGGRYHMDGTAVSR